MKSNQSTASVNVVRSKPPLPPTRRINLNRFALVADPFRRDDPDEQAPPCPACRSAAETVWFRDRRTGMPKLVCLACVPYQPTNEFPEAEQPAGASTKHLLPGEFPRLA